MGFLKREDIIAYQVGERVLCEDCYRKDQTTEADQYHTEEEFNAADDIVICDECGKTIWK